MPTAILNGQTTWSLSQDREGYREYRVTFRVVASPLDGPANVLSTLGIPPFGSWWIIDDDVDTYAWCTHEATVKPDIEGEPCTTWTVERVFSTKPPDVSDRPCKDLQVEDPLLEIPQVSGSFVRYSVEATQDKNGRAIMNSAWERMSGPQLEFDGNRPQVKLQMNVPSLDLALLASMVDTVNTAPLWGMNSRCIKLSEAGWERKFYGQCYVYYTLDLTFDLNINTFDRLVLDEGSKVLKGHWDQTTGAWVTDPVGVVAAPPAPVLTFRIQGGTTLALGTYSYAVTTVTAAGETMLGPSLDIDVSQTGYVLVQWERQELAVGYNVYRDDGSGAGFKKLAIIVSGTITKYKDDGSFSPSGAPPTKSTAGVIAPDYLNPAHFIKAKDRHGELMHMVLNGFGMPANKAAYKGVGTAPNLGTATTTEGLILVQYYQESDFTLLGIPLTF